MATLDDCMSHDCTACCWLHWKLLNVELSLEKLDGLAIVDRAPGLGSVNQVDGFLCFTTLGFKVGECSIMPDPDRISHQIQVI